MNNKKRMRKISAAMAAALLVTTVFSGNAFALNYSGSQENEATFETLEEARASAPGAVQNLELNEQKTFINIPVLDGIPEGTVFVYRSPNMYGGRAAGRMNTNLLLYAEQHFENADEAEQYIKDLGLTDIMDKETGSIILVTPADGTAFGQADQNIYYKLQTTICSLGARATDENGNPVAYAEPDYFGGFGYIYAVGIDGGASFLNNYVASAFDFSSRIAGMLLINGQMASIRKASSVLPVYLVNPTEKALNEYKKVNDVDAEEDTAETNIFYNQEFPLQKVMVAQEEHDNAWFIKDAFENLFTKAMRLPVGASGLNSAGTPYQGVGNDKAPYSLCERVDMADGVTPGGLHLIRQVEDTLSEYKTDDGEYIQTWFEYIPEDVLDGTAPAGSVPLVLGIHGTADDPRQYADEIGLIALAEHEHFAIVSPEHNSLGGLDVRVEPDALAALVKTVLGEYPALDASRVYATGYSMGGGSTMKVTLAHPELFAAAVPMSPVTFDGSVWQPSEEDLAQFGNVDLPVMLTTSGCDLPNTYDQQNDHILDAMQGLVNQMRRINEITEVETFDFNAEPYCGFRADRMITKTLNNEYVNRTWFMDKDGIPMVGLSITEGLVHALYPEYGKLFWDFASHYCRDQETGGIVYKP